MRNKRFEKFFMFIHDGVLLDRHKVRPVSCRRPGRVVVTAVFDEELREQLAQARRALNQARERGDDDGAQAYAGRVAGLLRIAADHGIDVPHTAEEAEQGES
jgi:hypothetical protein